MFQQQSLGFHPLGYNGVQWIIMGIKDITAPRLDVGMMLRIGPTIPSPFFFQVSELFKLFLFIQVLSRCIRAIEL